MAADWIDRVTRGSAAEHLTPDQFRGMFPFPAEWIDERIKDGTIPPPLKPTARTVVFTWEHVVCFALWLKLTGPALGGAASKPGKDSPP